MKSYYADSNILLRFLLRDNEPLFQRAKKHLESAKNKQIKFILTTETLLEVNYVLRKVYNLTRPQTAQKLKQIITTPYLEIENRNTQTSAVENYQNLNVDLADLILFHKAQSAGAVVLTFDTTDFKKITKYNS